MAREFWTVGRVAAAACVNSQDVWQALETRQIRVWVRIPDACATADFSGWAVADLPSQIVEHDYRYRMMNVYDPDRHRFGGVPPPAEPIPITELGIEAQNVEKLRAAMDWTFHGAPPPSELPAGVPSWEALAAIFEADDERHAPELAAAARAWFEFHYSEAGSRRDVVKWAKPLGFSDEAAERIASVANPQRAKGGGAPRSDAARSRKPPAR